MNHALPTPKSILLSNPFDSAANNVHARSSSRPSSPANTPGKAQPLSSAEKSARWILTPRRGHAALNAGIRSLAAEGEVTLVAWPGDMRRGVAQRPEDEDYGDLQIDDLSTDLRNELESGLRNIGGQGRGVRCRAVWLEQKMAKDFYDGMCKGFLWPVFHYFVRDIVAALYHTQLTGVAQTVTERSH